MAYLDSLGRLVAQAMRNGRIGRAVALRAHLQLAADHGLLPPLLAEAVDAAGAWVQSRPVRLYAQGGAEAGYITALAEFGAGQTALVTVETCRTEAPSAALLLIGNHGTLEWHDRPEELLASARGGKLRAVIERSLQTGKPEAIGDAG